MKIKAKLILVIGLLFAMIVLLTVMSAVYVTKLSNDTKNILVANYNTLDYSRQMLIALNGDVSNEKKEQQFEANLAKQRSNITEVCERELTEKLTVDFRELQKMWATA